MLLAFSGLALISYQSILEGTITSFLLGTAALIAFSIRNIVTKWAR
jgi:hypothetical protein